MPTPGEFTDADRALLAEAGALLGACRSEIETQRFHEALKLIWAAISSADSYIDAQAPWALKKTDPARMATVLYVLAETIRHIGALLQPVMPDAMAKLLDQLAVAEDKRSFASLGEAGRLVSGTALPPPQGLFPRIADAQPASAGCWATATATSNSPISPPSRRR